MKGGFMLFFCKEASEMHILRNKKHFIMRGGNDSEQAVRKGCEPLKVLKTCLDKLAQTKTCLRKLV